MVPSGVLPDFGVNQYRAPYFPLHLYRYLHGPQGPLIHLLYTPLRNIASTQRLCEMTWTGGCQGKCRSFLTILIDAV